MKKNIIVLILSAAALASSGCSSMDSAGNKSVVRLDIEKNHQLHLAAQKAMHRKGLSVNNDDNLLPVLTLSEEHSSSTETLAADGTISSYEVSYTLTYQLGDKPPQSIKRGQVVDHDENRYHAGKHQRRQIVKSLRRSALAQMIIALQLAQ